MASVIAYDHNIDMGGNRIADLGDPTSPGEAATKGYVDRVILLQRDYIEALSVRVEALEVVRGKR